MLSRLSSRAVDMAGVWRDGGASDCASLPALASGLPASSMIVTERTSVS